jgi:hypothetical protein
MTEHFVTLFDSTFLPNGLALHKSLERNAGDFHLWVVCMDNTTERAINQLNLERITTLPLDSVENAELRAVKSGRSIAEYCWTLTPFSVDFVFDRDPTIERVTYVDSDVWFVKSPQEILQEMTNVGAESLITPHAYSPEHAANIRFGIYCVQFMPFTRTGSLSIRRDWQSKCLDWCFARAEPDRFGDQKYLDTWPKKFPETVHVLNSVEKTQAPWNATVFSPDDAVLYHFHRLRLASTSRAYVGTYRLPRATVQKLYRPYLADVKAANIALGELGIPFTPQIKQLAGWPLVKDYLDFRRHNWRDLTAPYVMRY